MTSFKEITETMTEEEKEKVRQKLLFNNPPTEPFAGIQVIFFFPEKLGLKSADVKMGYVPRIGEKVYIHTWSLNSKNEYNYTGQRHSYFIVKRVYTSITIAGKAKDELLYDNISHAEVELVEDYTFRDFLRKIGYYWLWRKFRFLRRS